jgi:hypothetical protein
MATSTPPASTARTIDFAKCFRFVPEDPDWVKKILIGGGFALLSALLIGIPFVAGYWGRTLKRVAAGDARPLPEWDDLGGIFGEGIKLALVGLAYSCMILLVIASVGCVIGFFFMGAEALDRQSRGAGSAMAALGGTGIVALYLFFIVAALVVSLYLPAALVRVVLRGELGAGFEFARHVAFIRYNLVNYLLSILFYLVANFLSQFGVILCCVGVFPAGFWAYLILAYALGETVRLNPGSV